MVPHPTALTCKEVVELVTELLGDALAPEDRARLEQHLLVCPPCTLHVGQVRSTVALLGDLREPARLPSDTALAGDLREAAGSPAAALEVFRRWKARGA